MFANPYRLAIGGFRELASSQRLVGLALALITAGSEQAQEVYSTPDVPPTIRAVRVQAAVYLDGSVNEADWQRAVLARGFRQAKPRRGNPGTFDGEVRASIVDECTSPVGNSRMAVTSTRVICPTI